MYINDEYRKLWLLILMIVLLAFFATTRLNGQSMSIYADHKVQLDFETFGEWDMATQMEAYYILRGYEEFDCRVFELPFDELRGYHSYINYIDPDVIVFWRLYPDRYIITLHRKPGIETSHSLVNFTLRDAHLGD